MKRYNRKQWTNNQTEDEFSGFIDGRPVHESPISEGCLRMMFGWLNRCREEHKECPTQFEAQRLPTRVLDVGSEGENIRLVVSNGRSGKWAALSHFWGGFSVNIGAR